MSVAKDSYLFGIVTDSYTASSDAWQGGVCIVDGDLPALGHPWAAPQALGELTLHLLQGGSRGLDFLRPVHLRLVVVRCQSHSFPGTLVINLVIPLKYRCL
jgi:hypothetical protein